MRELIPLAFYLTGLAAWFTSLIYAVSHERVALAIADIVIFPVGVIHGLYLWFT